MRVNCHKCGAELRSEQKVCIKCGTRTIAGGNFDVEEKQPFEITRSMKYVAAAAVLMIIVLLVAQCLRVTPPDVIAQEWFDAMAQRDYNRANQFHSPEFTSNMQTGITDTQALSDYIYDELNTKQGQGTVGKPIYTLGVPNEATVNIAMSYADGHTGAIQVIFTKIGRRWLVKKLVY